MTKRRLNPTAFLIGSIALGSSWLAGAQQEPKAELNARREVFGAIENIKVHSVALERNKLGDPADQDVAVYLPPSYRSSSAKRYPSLYLLHGFDSNIRAWTSHGCQEMNLQQSMDTLIADGEVREMIVVVPNGRNTYLGSFYTNSIVSGGWEDFVDRDLLTYIDNTKTKRFTFLADRCILGNKGMVRTIMAAMNLLGKNTDKGTDKGTDSHYRCPAYRPAPLD